MAHKHQNRPSRPPWNEWKPKRPATNHTCTILASRANSRHKTTQLGAKPEAKPHPTPNLPTSQRRIKAVKSNVTAGHTPHPHAPTVAALCTSSSPVCSAAFEGPAARRQGAMRLQQQQRSNGLKPKLHVTQFNSGGNSGTPATSSVAANKAT